MGQSNKLTAEIDGVPVINRVLSSACASSIENLTVVTGFRSAQVLDSISEYDVTGLYNPEYELGISSSIRKGVFSLPDKANAVVIFLGDMPDVTSETIDLLVSSYDPGKGHEICVPVFKGQRGNPVLWSRRFFNNLCALEGDVGGRKLMQQYLGFLHQCEVMDEGILLDIDTPDQLNSRQSESKLGHNKFSNH